MFPKGYFTRPTTSSTSTTTTPSTTVDLSLYLKKTDLPPEYRSKDDADQGWYWLHLTRQFYQNVMPIKYRGSPGWAFLEGGLSYIPSAYKASHPGATLSDYLTDVQNRVQSLEDAPVDLVTPPVSTGPRTEVAVRTSETSGVVTPDNSTLVLTPQTFYVCNPNTVFQAVGQAALSYAWFMFTIPVTSDLFYFTVYNRSETTELRLRTNEGCYFVRGSTVPSYRVAHTIIPVRKGMTYLYVPPEHSPYVTSGGTRIHAFVELDWTADETKALTPVLTLQ